MSTTTIYDADGVGAFGTAYIRIDCRGDFQDTLRERRSVRFVVVRERFGLPTAEMMAVAAVADFVENGNGDVVAGLLMLWQMATFGFFTCKPVVFAAKLATGFDDFYETGAAERVQVFQAAGEYSWGSCHLSRTYPSR